ncbi:bck1-like resistance to osmotic shock [Nowakowskiella sp. JEL0078]|nr:bck1-like resistance to osmotic shock [Nowakowskiella sp. JEL0078]
MSGLFQAPLLFVSAKKTNEVNFAPSFRSYIQSTYQEDPDTYAAEISNLQRLRQDARGAGKDITGRDILYRYYGQLELLDLRFPVDEKNVKILFEWHDAFSNKVVSQYSIAYEKACVIFNLAATCSAIAAHQNRFEPEGLKLAYNYYQTAAGLFSYINDNFLHAPSTDLSRDSIKTLVDLMLAQAQEIFLEKLISEKKAGTLVSKLAAHTAFAYNSVAEGLLNESLKGQFEKSWIDLSKIKSKYFATISHLHRGFHLEAEAKYGEFVAHMTQAETLAKETNKLASQFASNYPSFNVSSSTSKNSDDKSSSTSAITDLTKSLLQTTTEKKNQAIKDNDLIYNASVPSVDTLPPIDKKSVVKLMTFAEICSNGQADIPKIIGPDIFIRLVPLNVHESSSLYSEEKAKILRFEQSNVENADGELQAMLESLNVMPILSKLKMMMKGSSASGVDAVTLEGDVRNWVLKINKDENGSDDATPTHELLSILDGLKQKVREILDDLGMQLDREQHECEGLRIRYGDQWTQEPSIQQTTQLRQDIRQNRDAFERALATDQILLTRLREVSNGLDVLKRPIDEAESIFSQKLDYAVSGPKKHLRPSVNLLDDVPEQSSDGLGVLGEQIVLEKIDTILGRLRSLKAERTQALEDLKNQVHQDDISSLLLLNKNKESQIFQTELAKFKPLETKISSNTSRHAQSLNELTVEFEKLKETSKNYKLIELRDYKKQEIIKEWKVAFEQWRDSKEGFKNGIQFYTDLGEIVDALKKNVMKFVERRSEERTNLIKKIEQENAERGQRALREQLHRLSLNTAVSPSTPSVSSPSNVPVNPYSHPQNVPFVPSAPPYVPSAGEKRNDIFYQRPQEIQPYEASQSQQIPPKSNISPQFSNATVEQPVPGYVPGYQYSAPQQGFSPQYKNSSPPVQNQYSANAPQQQQQPQQQLQQQYPIAQQPGYGVPTQPAQQFPRQISRPNFVEQPQSFQPYQNISQTAYYSSPANASFSHVAAPTIPPKIPQGASQYQPAIPPKTLQSQPQPVNDLSNQANSQQNWNQQAGPQVQTQSYNSAGSQPQTWGVTHGHYPPSQSQNQIANQYVGYHTQQQQQSISQQFQSSPQSLSGLQQPYSAMQNIQQQSNSVLQQPYGEYQYKQTSPQNHQFQSPPVQYSNTYTPPDQPNQQIQLVQPNSYGYQQPPNNQTFPNTQQSGYYENTQQLYYPPQQTASYPQQQPGYPQQTPNGYQQTQQLQTQRGNGSLLD